MKLPSLSKTPQWRRFEFTTRYYDAAKEDLQSRIEIARKEAKQQDGGGESIDIEASKKKLHGAFQRARKSSSNGKVSMLQFSIVVAMCTFLYLYWHFGNHAFWFIVPVYAAYRLGIKKLM